VSNTYSQMFRMMNCFYLHQNFSFVSLNICCIIFYIISSSFCCTISCTITKIRHTQHPNKQGKKHMWFEVGPSSKLRNYLLCILSTTHHSSWSRPWLWRNNSIGRPMHDSTRTPTTRSCSSTLASQTWTVWLMATPSSWPTASLETRTPYFS